MPCPKSSFRSLFSVLSFACLLFHLDRVQTLGLAVEDVLQKWTTEAAALYVSTEVLLESLLTQIASNNHGEGVPVTAPDNRFENMKRLIDTFLLAAKRINNPLLPMEVWTQKTNVSYDEFCKVFPFAPAWVQCLPVAFQGKFDAHG